MFSEVRKRVKKAGLPPGTLTYTGNKKNVETTLTVINYGVDHYDEMVTTRLEECAQLLAKPGTTWVHVEGLNNVPLIEALANRYDLHPLTVEDILNVEQRPKVEEFTGYLFVTLKVLHLKAKTGTFTTKQLSLVLGKDFLLSFEEYDTQRFHNIAARLKSTPKQRLREQGSDYLLYRLIDTVIDEYFIVLESLGEQIEVMEEHIIASPTPQNARVIYRLKRQMLLLRKAIWPMREAISHLMNCEESLISKFTRVYLRDVYDHTVQAIDTVETFRDILASMLDMYLSSLTNRMNEIMKTLTIITTIFIPITAIASIYGMNFSNMPGQNWQYGFATVMVVIVIITAVMMLYFHLKKWF